MGEHFEETVAKQKLGKSPVEIIREQLNNYFDNDKRLRIEILAMELHKNYRAAYKAMTGCVGIGAHDHGWKACRRQDYFRARAKGLIESWKDIFR